MNYINFDKLLVRVFLGVSEIATVITVSVLSVTSGLIFYFLRKHVYTFLNWIGLSYFSDRHNLIRDVNSDLIWCQGALHASSYALFRTFNGKAYVGDNTNTNQIQKIKIRKFNSKPEYAFPETLTYFLYRSIIDLAIATDWQLISYDYVKKENQSSPLLVFLEANNIGYLLSYRIWDYESHTYGIVLFTWNKQPDLDYLFTREVSKKLDSASIRFQNYISSSLLEKFNVRMDG